MRKTVHYEYDSEVQNNNGKFSGDLQYKVWKLGMLRTTVKWDDNKDNGQLQCKVWNPGRWKLKTN